MSNKVFAKGRNDRLDYALDWSAWLDGDTIATSAWRAGAGITLETDSHTDTMTTVWVSGGTLGQEYMLTNTVVTAGGRTVERSLRILVTEI